MTNDWEPVSRDWPGPHAVLFVHGVGNAMPGYYNTVSDQVRGALRAAGLQVAMYELYYDELTDWAASKFNITTLVSHLKSSVVGAAASATPPDSDGSQAAAEYMGDVLLPAFSATARSAIHDAYRAQLLQMLMDAWNTQQLPPRDVKLSIICHSLGGFHTYEVLHDIAANRHAGLRPQSDGVRFHSVIFMASPVQLIRTMFRTIEPAIPNSAALAVLHGDGLQQPVSGDHRIVDKWISITGDHDPIGGYFMKKQAGWAYMNTPDQVSIVDSQSREEGYDMKAVFAKAHSWSEYVKTHAKDLASWLA